MLHWMYHWPNSPLFSGRELFLSDASLFVDDAEAYEKYNREEQPNTTEQKVVMLFFFSLHNVFPMFTVF